METNANESGGDQWEESGGDEGTRTLDLPNASRMLYQLSYVPMVTGVDILQDFGVLPNSGSQTGDIFGARRGVIFAAETRKKPEPRRRESANCVRSLGCADGTEQ